MMKPNGLAGAVAVLALLGGGVFWTLKHPKVEKPATPDAPKILSVAPDQIAAVQIVRAAVPAVSLKKTGDTWAMTEPAAQSADQDAAQQLAGAFSLTSDRLIEASASDLSSYGLNTPSTTATVTQKDGKTFRVLIGADTPSGNGAYAKLDGDAKVYTISAGARDAFNKGVNDLRDRRLLPFAQDKITAVSFTGKGPAVEFGKNAKGDWQITKPKPMRADSPQVDELIRRLKEAKMDLTADAAKTSTEFAAAVKAATAAVTDAGGTMSVEIRKAKDGVFYAKSTAVAGVYKLAGDLGAGIDKSADDFRNKKLFDFAFTDPSKVQAGDKKYEKTGDKWFWGSTQVESVTIQALVDKLRDLAASKFGTAITGSPALSLKVTYGDKGTVENVVINKAGADYVAVRENDTSAYILDQKTFEDLQKAVSEIKPAAPVKDDKKK